MTFFNIVYYTNANLSPLVKLGEQGPAAWGDAVKKDKLQRLLVQSNTSLGTKTPPPNGAPAHQPTHHAQGYRSRYGSYSQFSEPGDKACLAYNRAACTNNASHPQELHSCAYCLRSVFKLCKHTEAWFNRKTEDVKNGAVGV